MRRHIFGEEHEFFRESAAAFFAKEVAPHHERWSEQGRVDRSLFTVAGEMGLLGFTVPQHHGGAGITDFRFNAILVEEAVHAGFASENMCLQLHNDVALPYFLAQTTEEQQQRWLPGMVTGEHVTAIAMTEPEAGSDLAGLRTTAILDRDHYVVNGAKTFITNGLNADVVITAVRTDSKDRHRGISLLVLEEGMDGFTRGRNLDKLGLHGQDTAELHFDDVHVPVENLLGDEGEGFRYMTEHLPQERLTIAVNGVAAARTALRHALEYVKERQAFGRPIGAFQNTQFVLAECATEVEVTEQYVDRCIEAHAVGALSAVDASKAKWWATEMQKRVVDRCLQLFGGYGYMMEYPIAHQYADARVTTIYGGTTEIMKTMIAKDLGLR